jgi:muconolactone delta-isomerase
MKILAIEKEVAGIKDEQFTPDILKKESERAWELYRSGAIRELYFRHDRQEAVLVLECRDTEEARSVLATLPLVRSGLLDFEIIPLTAYPGFERLFKEERQSK